jgi:hypothetical protein
MAGPEESPENATGKFSPQNELQIVCNLIQVCLVTSAPGQASHE